ncbi:hypothetical protein CDD80_84 [Ophiocordyceps camponoti-rufipedis]|uniref:Uncharacterized protein n=1 Tax=Ophiocordyceps camponoti-rufipedis TaxID=2004952 RepID=A0A2C5ZL43_9HYPO|nr:hypothetical protein CDD80_84 [Ophiocordyceps camponoti-rufipedis]
MDSATSPSVGILNTTCLALGTHESNHELTTYRPILQVLAILLLGFMTAAYVGRRGKPSLPPGPRPLPLVGNLRDMPPKGALLHEHWLKHKELYGPVTSVTVLGQTVIVLHDRAAANYILETNSIKTANRACFSHASVAVGATKLFVMGNDDERQRKYRKLLQHEIGSATAMVKYHALLEDEADRLLVAMLQDPSRVFESIRTMANANIMGIAYGYQIERNKADPLLELFESVPTIVEESVSPFASPVDYLPWLQHLPNWFPGTGYRQKFKARAHSLLQSIDQPFLFTRQQMNQGINQPSVLSNLIARSGRPNGSNDFDLTPDQQDSIKWMFGSLHGAGSDTTSSAVASFIIAMMLFPDVQRKAQQEIDRVVGPHRLPNLEDRANLPYIQAVIKELGRWYTIVPMGFFHTVTEDLLYDGYLIPKGAHVLPAAWGMNHDASVYKDPDEFKPERFSQGEPEPRSSVFGYGRRVCPGQKMGEASLFCAVSKILAVFNISKSLGHDGQPLDVKPEMELGFISRPKPVPCVIEPRSEKHELLVRGLRT